MDNGLIVMNGRKCECGYVFGESAVEKSYDNCTNFYSASLSTWVKKHAFYKYYDGKESIFSVDTTNRDPLSSILNKIELTEAKYSPTSFLGDKDKFYPGAPHFMYKYRKILRKNHLLLPQRKQFLYLATGANHLDKRMSFEHYYLQLLHHDERSQHHRKKKQKFKESISVNETAHECCLCSCCFRQYGMPDGCKNPFCNDKSELIENNFICCVNGTEVTERIMLVLSILHPEITYFSFINAFTWIIMHYVSDEWEIFFILACLISSKHYEYFDQTILRSYVSSLTIRHLSQEHTAKHCKKGASHPMIDNFLALQLPKYFKNDPSIKIENKFIIYEWKFRLLISLPLCIQIRLLDSFIIEGPEVFTRIMLYFVNKFPKYLKDNFSSKLFNHDFYSFQDLFRRFIEENYTILFSKIFDTSARKDKFKYYEEIYIKLANSGVIDADGAEGIHKPPFCISSVDLVQKSPILIHDFHGCNLKRPSSPTTMITNHEWAHLEDWIPPRIKLFIPNVVFTTKKHGCNLKTLYHLCEMYHPCILLIHTDRDEVFGAYMTCALKHRHNTAFFGTGETFLFRLRPEIYKYDWIVQKRHKEAAELRKLQFEASNMETDKSYVKNFFKRFRRQESVNDIKANINVDPSPAQINIELVNVSSESSGKQRGNKIFTTKCTDDHLNLDDLFIAGDDYSLIIGGGGTGFGLQIDANLYNGNSARCSTFENDSLTGEIHGDFRCLRVDVIWYKDEG